LVASKVVVTAAQCCERIQDKHKALVSAGSLKPLSQEAHVRDVLKVGFASRFLQTIRCFLKKLNAYIGCFDHNYSQVSIKQACLLNYFEENFCPAR
jgi:hypothetical protein